ncbi:hypothetical protein [Acidithiobacillus thiooxidans]|uniref:DUF551 domain-containing protein n=1 Tax=Acidithiobacillus thiooxidans ATCC 19377 TaxID=637390 RepID=A0A5P9XRP5_ACITH|nr:hypothetical protein [Acidithiobacillus thiooxidans]QFX96033.1 hypothetical protein GCD22_01744 [Acidithiobacillus thiooxidans ATCC 19377]
MGHWNRLTPLTPELAKTIGKDPVLIFIDTLGVIEACLRQSSDYPEDGEWIWFGSMNIEHWPFDMASYWMPLPAQPHKTSSQERPKDQETVLIWVKNLYGKFPAPEFGWLQARYHAEDCSWRAANASDTYWIHDSEVMGWIPFPEKKRNPTGFMHG